MPNVILVDAQDNPIGTAEKLMAHQQGWLHRAFSVFIFRQHAGQTEILLQQRQSDKYHAASLWTNTCCSHPEPEENTLAAGERRLKEELGFSVALREIGVFTYRAEFSNGLVEHEVDHVLVGKFLDTLTIIPNKEEVMDYHWMSLEEAEKDFQTYPEKYTPWFYSALAIAKPYLI